MTSKIRVSSPLNFSGLEVGMQGTVKWSSPSRLLITTATTLQARSEAKFLLQIIIQLDQGQKELPNNQRPWSPPPKCQTRSESLPVYKRRGRTQESKRVRMSMSPTRASRRANHKAMTSMPRHYQKNRGTPNDTAKAF